MLISWACVSSEVAFPEAAADGGGREGAAQVMVRTAGSCGDVRLYGMFFLLYSFVV